MLPWNYSWADMDPGRHPFDRDHVTEVVRTLPPAADFPDRQPDENWRFDVAWPWLEAMTAALIDHYGPWAAGWRWTTGEGDVDGGVVAAWCCASHSIKDRDTTLTAMAASLVEWRDWLERLAGWFDRFLPIPPGADEDALLELWERAVVLLITQAVDWTGCQSGWQKTAHQSLEWFLQAAGVPASRHETLIKHAMGGRFRSWVTPTTLTIIEAAETMATDLSRA